ncbi:hypothetical protein FIV42_20275 [Persicimonas caeni]|uniref:Uncharacterized protein n=1 Tax=Persicimonas caeni TaxID=2292766 RepID=A0A4Y6PYB4_PERCE|nr:hypothetical protein [Persicimonas caeni]QDG52997.1 hypothetical protein FIV42_20275 [Persicimonas caeni]QED34219.1 hypothetical protein FRD00_20270 [Persicimonas caeni]
MAVAACGETDEQSEDFDSPTPVEEVQTEVPDTPLSGGGDEQVDVPVDEPEGGGPVDEIPPGDVADEGDVADGEEAEEIQVSLLAGKQLAYPEAWIAHAAANESECSHSRCPYLVSETDSEPAAVPPFERGTECMVEGGLAVGGGPDEEGSTTYSASAQAGAASATFSTDVSSGDDFVELAVQGEADAEEPTAGGVRADAGATLFADESALVLDIQNPSGEPVVLEVSWSLKGEPAAGEASWQGALWYTDRASRLDECYVAPDYQFDRVFDVFQDVGGTVRGQASGTARLPVSGVETAEGEHIQVGLRLNVGAHAVARAGSVPEHAQSSSSRVDGTLRFRVVPAEETSAEAR